WLATHMSPAGHLGDTNFRHGPSCSAEAGKLTGNGSGQTGGVPWFDRYPVMASAWQMSGSVPVNHPEIRAGQDADDLVDVLSDESRHARIRTQIFLARGARKGLRRAGPLLASSTAGLG